MYPLDDNSFDKPETSTEEIPSETEASFTLLQTETPSLISEPPSETLQFQVTNHQLKNKLS